MDKASRAELLRIRFKAKGGFPFVFKGVRKATPELRPKPAKICLEWPEANRDTRRAGVWMHKPDPKPKVIPRTKRDAGVSALTKIGKSSIGKKLVRKYASAEGLLAERARR